jgi:membrane fusion protein (multidrug efflux system)
VVVDANLYAPVDSRVLRVLGVAGQPAQRGEALVLLLPEGASVTENYWVQAYFMGESADFIQPGQPCRVELEDGQNLRGVVQDVLAPQALPTGQQGAQGVKSVDGAAKPAMYVPARISVDPGANPLPAPGTSARCVVMTRSILGFYGF